MRIDSMDQKVLKDTFFEIPSRLLKSPVCLTDYILEKNLTKRQKYI